MPTDHPLDMVGVLGSIPSVPTKIGQGLASACTHPDKSVMPCFNCAPPVCLACGDELPFPPVEVTR